jgi:hypothetical protein
MPTYILVLIHLTLIALLSAGLAYLIMRWTFSPSRHDCLSQHYNGMNIAGLNSGAIMLLALGLAFVFNQISTTHQAAKLAVLQEADALRTLGRISINIDPSVGMPLLNATRLYTQTVIDKEWPKLNQGKSVVIRQGVDSALQPLTEMSDIVFASGNLSKLPAATSNQLSQLVTRVREKRLIRIDASTFSIGVRGLILAVITLAASSALISLALLTKRRMQFVSNFALFVVVLTAMYLAFAGQNPFAGLDFLVDAPLRDALDRLNSIQVTKNP